MTMQSRQKSTAENKMRLCPTIMTDKNIKTTLINPKGGLNSDTSLFNFYRL